MTYRIFLWVGRRLASRALVAATLILGVGQGTVASGQAPRADGPTASPLQTNFGDANFGDLAAPGDSPASGGPDAALLGGPAAETEEVITVEAEFTTPTEGTPALLFVTARVKPGWHIYSVTQPPGGPIATKLRLDDPSHLPDSATFVPLTPPTRKAEAVFNNLVVESHGGTVVWVGRLNLPADVDPQSLRLAGRLNAQACTEGACNPPRDFPFTATLGQGHPLPPEIVKALVEPPAGQVAAATARRQEDTGPASLGTFRHPHAHAVLSGYLEATAAAPGETVRLILRAEPQPGYHVYAYAPRDPEQVSKPTLVVLTSAERWQVGEPKPTAPPVVERLDAAGGQAVRFYSAPVEWAIELRVPADAAPGPQTIAGVIGYQTCTESACDRPVGARFEAQLQVAPERREERTQLTFREGKYREAAELAAARQPATAAVAPVGPDVAGTFSLDALQVNASDETGSMPAYVALGLAFMGGLVLNLMPCVLPVIGLKILSFVEQAGQSRRQVFLLNVWYAIGMLSVFLLLANLAVSANLGWGQQFGYSGFNITLAAVVFAMGLSFLGVWEIPIPGFVGHGAAQDLAAREGYSGAFFKGAVTTLLATPCSGPGLGTALVWAASQPPALTYAVFTAIGLGMASPYLLIGAFPRLIRRLPKPGAWMDTFRQLMGFVLLGTVAYLLTIIPWVDVVPTVVLLFGVWAACWWIGRTPLTAPAAKRWRAWLQAAAVTAVVFVAAFPGIDDVLPASLSAISFGGVKDVMAFRFQRDIEKQVSEVVARSEGGTVAPVASAAAHADAPHELPWEAFQPRLLEGYVSAGQTVLVDFTANWCQTCKTLEAYVLNTPQTKARITAAGVKTLVADWTYGDEQVTRMLERLGSKQIPVVAIFPSGKPTEPIVLRGGYTQKSLFEALDRAGPSRASKMAAEHNVLR